MAVVTLGLPIFEGKEDDDVNTFINLFQGYLHGINVDPVANSAQALGILRGCMKGNLLTGLMNIYLEKDGIYQIYIIILVKVI